MTVLVPVLYVVAFALFILFGTLLLIHAIATSDSAP